jgi:hypothetical protein
LDAQPAQATVVVSRTISSLVKLIVFVFSQGCQVDF